MTPALILTLAGLAAMALWLWTGSDPLFWLIHGAIWLRAGLALAFKVSIDAALRWRYGLRDEVREMRAELMEGDL